MTVRISIYLMRPIVKAVTDALKEIGVNDYNINAGRSAVLEERQNNGFLSLFSSSSGMVDDPMDRINFLVTEEKEEDVLHYIIEKGQLAIPGRGSVYSEKIEIPKANECCSINHVKDFTCSKANLLSDITGLCCIVQRGNGDNIARVALNTGIGTPNITYGEGTGVRDKMGLLRITIPAEKELIWMASNDIDSDMLMDCMIKAGSLDQPGKGFIYLFPLRKGLLDMQITRGGQRSAATPEQIVAAIDQLQNGIEWRKRSDSIEGGSNRNYLTDLIDFTLLCDEGGSEELVSIAMNAGAPGSTISKIKHVCTEDAAGNQLSKSRESCNMIVSSEVSEKIISALEAAEAFTDKFHGQVLTRKAFKAFTYLGKS